MTSSWYERLWLWLALLLTVLLLLAPIILVPTLIAVFRDLPLIPPSTPDVAETTVGVGVILRATLRRVFRSGVRNVMQTTVGTFARTTARAVTRRVLRIASKTLILVFRKPLPDTEEDAVHEENDPPRSAAWALFLGTVALFASFWVILLLLPADKRADIVAGLPGVGSDPRSPGSLALPVAAGLSALPLLVYALLAYLNCRLFGVELRFHTGVDSMLLQAYFTGGVSFLPLTTDSEYRGPVRACALAACGTLGGLLALHLGLHSLGHFLAAPVLTFASHMMLLYAFIFAFPIKPLDGSYLWQYAKLLWVAYWLVILAVFITRIPGSFNVIL